VLLNKEVDKSLSQPSLEVPGDTCTVKFTTIPRGTGDTCTVKFTNKTTLMGPTQSGLNSESALISRPKNIEIVY